ncbi:MAG: hypothetical protein LBT52_01390 [Clostridiales Family XIII bacterium]|jgi:hypothetical protein|nr:hypothetical protein [Clostridiales Family XIII bacterium]
MSDDFNNNQETPEASQQPYAPQEPYAQQQSEAPQEPYAPPQPGAPQDPYAQQPSYAQQPYAPQQPAPTPTKAIVSLILGIISVALAWPTVGIVGIAGGIVSIVLAKQASREQKTGLATGGFALGIAGIVLGAIVLLVVGVFAVIFVNNVNSDVLQEAMNAAQEAAQ